MHYFSYGSNMSINRLRDRVPSASRLGTGELKGHQLRFNKVGFKDGTAKCDAQETGNPSHVVHGVVFRILEDEIPGLDKKEGLGYGYEKKNVAIELKNGTTIEAYTYYATNIDSSLKPLDWYKEHVMRGAIENNLPAEYIQMIESVEMVKDGDVVRRDRELSVYR